MKRLFVAIKVVPGEDLLEQYQRFRKWFRTDRISWVDEAHMHVTLRFIGDTPEEKVEAIHRALSKVQPSYSAFRLSIRGTGIFGSSYKPRVLWFGVDDSDGLLVKMEKDIAGVLEEAGWPDDRQNFVPHLTIGRIQFIRIRNKLNEKVEKNRDKHLMDMEVNAFHLIESRLTPDGLVYQTLHSYPLKGASTNAAPLPFWKRLLSIFGRQA